MSCLKSAHLIASTLVVAILLPLGASEVKAGSLNQTRWQSIDPVVRKIANHYRIDPYLVHAVIWQESNYNRRAISSKGAQGLMQLMPGTARELGVRHAFSAQDNIDGGTRYLIRQLIRFRSTKKALQAYHCGPERVASGRVPGISRRYANQVIARYRFLKRMRHARTATRLQLASSR